MINMNYTEAINKALYTIMSKNPKSVCVGLGINDPKRIFGTTTGLVEAFGDRRCIEPPTSENALTGISFGLALSEYAVCLIHQRFDFSLLSFDQIINTISKWSFMFGEDFKTPLLIRLIVGRGWGQGPTHSQSYHSFLASIPGLDVYYPSSPKTAYLAIIKSMSGTTPSIMIEHRWLHNAQESFEIDDLSNINSISARIIRKGAHFTVFTYGYMLPEAIEAAKYLSAKGIEIELVSTDLISKIETNILMNSVLKTKKLLLIEPFYLEGSFISSIFLKLSKQLADNSQLHMISTDFMSLPFENESTSYFQTKSRYNTWKDIVSLICKTLDAPIDLPESHISHHDVPGDWFKGPF